MIIEQPSLNSDNEKAISRRTFLRKAALVGGALVAGAVGMKLAGESGLSDLEKKEKLEKVGEGLILEKKHVPGLLRILPAGKIMVPDKMPDRYIFKIKLDNDVFDINVLKEQFDQRNANDKVSIKYELDGQGKIKSPKLLNTNKE